MEAHNCERAGVHVPCKSRRATRRGGTENHGARTAGIVLHARLRQPKLGTGHRTVTAEPLLSPPPPFPPPRIALGLGSCARRPNPKPPRSPEKYPLIFRPGRESIRRDATLVPVGKDAVEILPDYRAAMIAAVIDRFDRDGR